ncbi:ribosomal subunit interface protein [Candidatus Curtissbacteria bacterium RIFCSPLOWO2_01_FULL_41_18]|uniref:Ribosomal subunit interface protein n=1 Tax=Candidatus Curtissbacteria bacterium RIFCSPLOWO2_01_FULL_41_18 TaxID=1797727 RepID=A0A1F5HHI1_9BACT|nr:MAG: ribosomal subunit interface protein [Candidatus Curtissbacteria bacterium RIFCSPLOWO2_01_FULL_41_18]
MKIQITEIHIRNPKARDYAAGKVEKLAKFHPKIERVNVRLFGEKAHRNQQHDFTCEIEVAVRGHVFEIVHGERSIDKAIDMATDRAKRALVKHKEKHISLKHKDGVLSKLLSRLRT